MITFTGNLTDIGVKYFDLSFQGRNILLIESKVIDLEHLLDGS